MRKEIWGKRKLALVLSALLFAESGASMEVLAAGTEETPAIVSEFEDSIDADQAVSDGDADLTEENIDDSQDKEEGTKEETVTEEGNDKKDEEVTEDKADSSDDEFEEAVSDGNAETEDTEDKDEAVSDGNAEVPYSEEFNFETVVDGYTIKLHAETGVVPTGTEVSVEKVNKVCGEKTDDLVNEVLPEDSVVYESASFNITLIKDGQEFEPDDKVSVEITLNDKLADLNNENDSVSVQVFHIDDNAVTTEVPADVNDDATDVYDGNEETVVSYDAESFSVYDVSAVLNFTTTEVTAEVNPVYENLIDVSDEELQALGEGVDSASNVKALMASNGNCTSMQEMGEACKRGVMARQAPITINFKLPGIYNETKILNSMIPIAFEHTGVPNEGDYVQWASIMRAYQSSVAYVDGITYGSIQVKYVYTHNYAQEVATTNKINQIVTTLGLKNAKSDYAKAKLAYDWIVEHVKYDYQFNDKKQRGDYSPWSCYSAAVTNHTVCEGYALLFYRMMLIAGVDCRMVAGDGGRVPNIGGHGWNIVKLGNYYYNVDSTWGSEEKETAYKWFLKGSRNFDRVSYDGKSFIHARYDDYNTAEFNYVYPTSTTDFTSKERTNTSGVSVSLNMGSATVGVGSSVMLKATVKGSTNQSVMWSSSDSTVARVNTLGIVYGVGNGECEIFATSVVGGKKARCRVLVTDGHVKTIDADTRSITVYAGSKATINAYVFPTWASNKGIKYKSSNKSVASVSKSGVVTGKKPGKCTVTCTSRDGGYKVKIKIKVKKSKRVKSIKLTKKKLKLAVGERFTLGVKFNPKKATNKEVSWKSNKPGVVSVDANGNLVALSKGKAKITAKSADGKHKATCTVRVK